jgi:DNA repair protein RadC
MTTEPDASIFRIRELELRYREHRLDTPFKGSLEEARDVTMLAETMLRDSINDAAIVLHLTKRLRLLGVHRLPILTNREATVAEIIRAALLSNAAVLIYVHRRNSGDWASDEDGLLVWQLRRAARIFGTKLRDAIIIWSTPEEVTFYSFRDNEVL